MLYCLTLETNPSFCDLCDILCSLKSILKSHEGCPQCILLSSFICPICLGQEACCLHICLKPKLSILYVHLLHWATSVEKCSSGFPQYRFYITVIYDFAHCSVHSSYSTNKNLLLCFISCIIFIRLLVVLNFRLNHFFCQMNTTECLWSMHDKQRVTPWGHAQANTVKGLYLYIHREWNVLTTKEHLFLSIICCLYNIFCH